MGNLNTETIKCPICCSNAVSSFIDRKNVPVHQNIIFNDCESAVNIERGDLNMQVCSDCGFIFNESFDFRKISYGKEYNNAQVFSPCFSSHVEKVADYLLYEKKIHNSTIIEVGCGKGEFIKLLLKKDTGNIGYGFDPSYIGPVSLYNGRLTFKKKYYGPDESEISADIVVCRHVIEHVSSPLDILKLIRESIKGSNNAQIFFETPCVEWVLEKKVIWDFFYEHCSLFTKDSLKTAFQNAGFKVEKIDHVFGGQYLWAEATVQESISVETHKFSGNIPSLAENYKLTEQSIIRKWIAKIKTVEKKGNVAIWGAAAKGTTFVNMIDPDKKLIHCAIDLNPDKQGKFIAGTGHPIIRYEDIKERNITEIIVMNPNYTDEIIALLKQADINVNIIEDI